MKRKRKTKPFQLNCFGFFGIVLLLSGTGSVIFVYYAIMEMIK